MPVVLYSAVAGVCVAVQANHAVAVTVVVAGTGAVPVAAVALAAVRAVVAGGVTAVVGEAFPAAPQIVWVREGLAVGHEGAPASG